MPKYAVMIRGVGPSNPNMRGEKLKGALESLGFTNVKPVITSGNVVFESKITDTAKLETMIEAAFPKLLDFERDVFVRSQAQLQRLVDANPFAGLSHQNMGTTYLTITFFKSPPKDLPKLAYKPEGKAFELLTSVDGALCCVVDLTTGKTPDMMSWLERHYGKHLTTRTWKTVTRLLIKITD